MTIKEKGSSVLKGIWKLPAILNSSPFLTTAGDLLLAKNLQNWLMNIFSLDIFTLVFLFSKGLRATWQILARAPLVRGVWDIFPFKSEDFKSRLHMNIQNVTFLYTNILSIWFTCQFSLENFLDRRHLYTLCIQHRGLPRCTGQYAYNFSGSFIS